MGIILQIAYEIFKFCHINLNKCEDNLSVKHRNLGIDVV